MNKGHYTSSLTVPVLPVRDKVVFPYAQTSLVVGRKRSIEAIRSAIEKNRLIFIVAQRHAKVEEPLRDHLFEYGTVAEILQSIPMPDGLLRIRIVGLYRAKIIELYSDNSFLVGDVEAISIPSLQNEDASEMEALRRLLVKQFDEYAQKSGKISQDILSRLLETSSLDQLADLAADALEVSVEE